MTPQESVGPSTTEDPEVGSEFPAAFNRYVSRTQSWLDLLALSTIWLVLAIFTGQGKIDSIPFFLFLRIAISTIYLADLLIRSKLSGRGIRYPLSRPDLVISVVLPPIRIFSSMRLLRKMFSRGNLSQFLFVAVILMLNAAVIVWEFESRAPGANITTLGDALWWSVVTVTTVGYGDYSPVTFGGRITAVALLVLGLVSVAVVTAQIASNFLEQAPGNGGNPKSPPTESS
ncbi:MAG: ion channel [Acidimicrobiales bacterium]